MISEHDIEAMPGSSKTEAIVKLRQEQIEPDIHYRKFAEKGT